MSANCTSSHQATLTEEYLRLLVTQSPLLGSGVGGQDPLGGGGRARHSHDEHGASVEPLLTADLE